MVKVALLSPDDLPIPPIEGGSVQIYLNQLVGELAKLPSIDMTLISPGKIKRTSVSHIPIAARGPVYLRRALTQLRQIQPDVVQIENRPKWVPLVKETLPRAKVVLNLHSTTFLGGQHIPPHRVHRVLKQADAVTLNSRSLQRTIAKRHHLGQADWNPVVVYPGVSVEQFESKTDRTFPHAFTPSRPLRLLFVGRVIQQKGVHVLVETIRRLNRKGLPVSLTIIGKTPPWERLYRQRLNKQAAGLPIQFVGFVSPQKLAHHYQRADVLVCPSQGHEAFGLVNVEAMAAGLPVIASRQGGIREIVNESCGIPVKEYRHASAFQMSVQQVLQKPQTLATLSKGAREQASRFTWKQTAKGFSQIYQQFANRI